MPHFMIKSSFEEANSNTIEGFVLTNDKTREEINQALQKFVQENGEEYWFTDCDCVYDLDMDGFEVVEITEVEYDVIAKHFGVSYGDPIPGELFED